MRIRDPEIRPDYREFPLIENGRAVCTVVIGADVPEKVRAAAEDFAGLMEKMCGDRPMILTDESPLPENPVLIGASKYTAAEGFAPLSGYPENEVVYLKNCDNRCLVLLGNDSGAFFGTQFAVTMLFEKLGCGWFGPEELWQVVPKKENCSVGYLDVEQRPQFIARNNNVLFRFPEVGRRWYLGGAKRVAGHRMQVTYPPQKYFKDHPDWYCMIDGKRDPLGVDWWQFCYSNEEVVNLFADTVCDLFDKDPDLKQMAIGLNDGWYEGWCECEGCKKMGTNSEIAIRFANKVAKLVAKKYPDHVLTFLAYFPTYFPPTEEIPVEPNVEFMFCKECDMFLPVDKGPDNGYHLKYSYVQSKNTYPEPWRKNFEKWNEIAHLKQISIWDWYCIAAARPEWKDIPWVQGDVITRNHRYWSEHKVQYIYNDQGPLPEFYEDGSSFPLRWPLWYVNAKGMWDKDLTGSQILQDACRKLFGRAADLMLSYYLALADIAIHNEAKTIGWHPPDPDLVYQVEDVIRIDDIFAAISVLKPHLTKEESARVENQQQLWEKAKGVIAASAVKHDRPVAPGATPLEESED